MVLILSRSAAERRRSQTHGSPSKSAGRSFFALSHKICQAVSLSPSDSGFTTSSFITDPGGNSVEVDPYNVQGLQGKRLPPGGAFTYQLAFYYPYGTTADQVQSPQKLLLEADPKHIDWLCCLNRVGVG